MFKVVICEHYTYSIISTVRRSTYLSSNQTRYPLCPNLMSVHLLLFASSLSNNTTNLHTWYTSLLCQAINKQGFTWYVDLLYSYNKLNSLSILSQPFYCNKLQRILHNRILLSNTIIYREPQTIHTNNWQFSLKNVLQKKTLQLKRAPR